MLLGVSSIVIPLIGFVSRSIFSKDRASMETWRLVCKTLFSGSAKLDYMFD